MRAGAVLDLGSAFSAGSPTIERNDVASLRCGSGVSGTGTSRNSQSGSQPCLIS